MKESTLTAQIMRYARARGCYAVKWHMTVYGSGGMPDVYVLVPSEPYAIPVHVEVKVPGNKPTPRQAKVLRDLRKSGAVAFWADNLADVCWVIDVLKEGYSNVIKYAENGRVLRAYGPLQD